MPIKNYKPNQAARKNMSIVDRGELHKGGATKTLSFGARRISGRGSAGKITTRHRGGGVKRKLRMVHFGQDKQNIPGRVERLEYDPNRSAHLALVLYADGERRYLLAWDGAHVGDEVVAGPKVAERPGNRLPLAAITPGAIVFNVEIKPGRGGKLFRAAGAGAILMDVQDKEAMLTLPSGEIRLIPKESYATLGRASNVDWWLTEFGSAGRKRRLGWRPSVRGKAQNPVDHPHGGGEGNQPIGLKAPKTKWGRPALGVKTRRRGKYSDRFIVKRRQKKK